MDEVWLNWKFKMAARRLFEHENDAHLYLLWILQAWMDSFEIWYAG
jgi:hypothetical protein